MQEIDKKTVSVAIDKSLYEDIKEYCNINGLKVGAYIQSKLSSALAEDKWGDAPFYNIKPSRKVVFTKQDGAPHAELVDIHKDTSGMEVELFNQENGEIETRVIEHPTKETEQEKKTTRRKLK